MQKLWNHSNLVEKCLEFLKRFVWDSSYGPACLQTAQLGECGMNHMRPFLATGGQQLIVVTNSIPAVSLATKTIIMKYIYIQL